MWRDYASQIQETEAELSRLERRHRGQNTGPPYGSCGCSKTGRYGVCARRQKGWASAANKWNGGGLSMLRGGAQLLEVKCLPPASFG